MPITIPNTRALFAFSVIFLASGSAERENTMPCDVTQTSVPVIAAARISLDQTS